MKREALGTIVAKGVWSPEQRHAQMRVNLARGLPLIEKVPAHDKRLDVCGFAPSIRQTWKEVQGDALTISGAHGLLIENGIIPKYHLEVDPRDDKTPYITPPHPDCTYLFSVTCAPIMFDAVKDYNCVAWINYNTSADLDFIADECEPGTEMILGGSTAGLYALVVGYLLGYRDIHVHGMDSSNVDEKQRHAGKHYGKPQKPMKVGIGQDGEEFWTSGQMVSQAREFFNVIDRMKDAHFTLHGHGLLQAMVPEEQKLKQRDHLSLFNNSMRKAA